MEAAELACQRGTVLNNDPRKANAYVHEELALNIITEGQKLLVAIQNKRTQTRNFAHSTL